MQTLVGHGVDGPSASALWQLGINPASHRARQFDTKMAAEADLVLTAERAHRDEIMTQLPTAFRRIFTMKEFARLARHVTPGTAATVIAEVAGARGDGGCGAVGRRRHARPVPGHDPRGADDRAPDHRHCAYHDRRVLGVLPCGDAVATPVVQDLELAQGGVPDRIGVEMSTSARKIVFVGDPVLSTPVRAVIGFDADLSNLSSTRCSLRSRSPRVSG